MSESKYKGGSTLGGRWGCAIAAFVGLPLFFVLFLGAAMGDCLPEDNCKPSIIQNAVLPTALVAAFVGFGIRAIIKHLKK